MSLEFKDLLPLLTPAVAAGGVWLQGLFRARDDRYQGKMARDEAVEMIGFLEKWMKTQEMACSPEEFQQVKKAARQRLDEMYLTLDKVQKSRPQVREPPRPLMQRIFLLYHPETFGGWMARVIFYTMIVLGGFVAIGIFADFKSSDVGVGIAFYVTFGILILPIHAWAVNADAKGSQRKQAACQR